MNDYKKEVEEAKERWADEWERPEPIKHGKWIEAPTMLQRAEDLANGNKQYFCSNCDAGDLHAISVVVPYCWNCGAKMDEVDNG